MYFLHVFLKVIDFSLPVRVLASSSVKYKHLLYRVAYILYILYTIYTCIEMKVLMNSERNSGRKMLTTLFPIQFMGVEYFFPKSGTG